MDIRSYFTSNRKPSTSRAITATTDNSKSISNKRIIGRNKFVDSDSDNETTSAKTKGKRTFVSSDESDNEEKSLKKHTRDEKKSSKKHSKPFAISDSSSEDVTPKKKQKVTKLANVIVKSKFFKETSAVDVFGASQVKRDESRLSEIRGKLRKREAPSKGTSFDDDDAAFEAAISQMDEVGDNWVNWKEVEKQKKNSNIKVEESPNALPKNEKNVSKLKNIVNSKKTDLTFKTYTNDEISKDIVSHSTSEATVESGYDSQSTVYSNSQNKLDTSQLSDKQNQLNVGSSSIEGKSGRSQMYSPRIESHKGIQTHRNDLPKRSISQSTTSCSEAKPSNSSDSHIKANTSEACESLWVEKYKPLSSSKIIGQQGDKSNVKKLTAWLNNWYKNNNGTKKAAFVPQGWNKDPNGAVFKAALLSGPPGVGKTTTVSLVCKELGYDVVEFNASDTRSKKSLHEEVAKLLENTSLMPFVSKEGNVKSVTKKHVLVMDEVDGMAGNEDRGGIQELIQLIKSTKVPIVCMCNDRNHPKIRSLVNYCFDLRFARPRVEQIKGFVKSICFKEKLNVSADALTDIITSANNDIRLILNHLSMLAAHDSSLEAASKYIKLSAWDVLRKVFSKEDHKQMTIHDKCDLFFFDYNIAPLFVQENYLSVKPLNVKKNDKRMTAELFSRAADSISLGDIVDKSIRQNMAWTLLPTQAIFASYIPGEILEGYCGGQINFPSWLGKNSKRTKLDRLLQEIQVHTRLKVSASKEAINLDYASQLRNRIMRPLIHDGSSGVQEALNVLHEYQLLKEDLDSLHELCQWSNASDAITNLDSKVKAAFTRLYNKNPPVRPYSLSVAIKKGSSIDEEILKEEGAEENSEEEVSDDEADAMIIKKKKQAKKNETAPSTSKTKPQAGGETKKKRKK